MPEFTIDIETKAESQNLLLLHWLHYSFATHLLESGTIYATFKNY
jgi:site-specific recombinase XerD